MLVLTLICIFVGSAMLLSLGIWMMVKGRKCTHPLNAVLVRFDEVRVKRRVRYVPIFRYEYDGERYESRGFIGFSKKEVKKYLLSKTYAIYINPYKPKDFVVTQKIDSSVILLIAIGVLFVVFAFLILSLV